MNEREEQQERANVAQKVLLARRAIEAGHIKMQPEHAQFVEELMAAPIGPLGLVDTRNVKRDIGFRANYRHGDPFHRTTQALAARDARLCPKSTG